MCFFLALLAPWAAYVSHVRDVRRLRALAARGELVHAVVTEASAEMGTLRYRYTVEGVRYTGAVRWPHVPYLAGDSIVVYCLPDGPSLSRPGAMLSDDAIALEAEPTFTLRVMANLFVFFAGCAGVAQVEVRRRRRSSASSPATAGRLAALALLAAVLVANLGPYAMSVERRALVALAASAEGVPAVVAAPLLEAMLLLPFFFLLPLFAVYVAAGERRARLHLARPILLAGLGYALVLLAALVAFTGGGKF